MHNIVICNATIVNESETSFGDILIEDGKIIDITTAGAVKKGKYQVIDATGRFVLPGLIDIHVHFNDPGRTHWEGIHYGSRSLAAGGVATFFDMPLNSNPPTTTVSALDLKKHIAKLDSLINYRFWGGLVPGNLEEIEALYENGVIGFKAFLSNSGISEFGRTDDVTLLKGMKKIASLGSILAVHAESEVITSFLASEKVAANKVTIRDYCESRPVASEIEAVDRLLSYAKITGCKLHIVHVSSGEVVALITEAKKQGVDVTAETCPHYLAFTIEDFEKIGPTAKCAPPLREEEDVQSLWDAIFNGDIDIIASDHSPSPLELKVMKDNNMFNVWGGIAGAQSTLHVLLEEGYWKRNVPLERIVQMTSTNPARRFGLYPNKGRVAVGCDADVTIVDVHQSFTLKEEDLYYRHRISPYIGKSFRGSVITTIVDGSIVYQNGETY